jgi:VCBS repeat-containing protein|tara:strand:- start:561 stop:1169 length:609 start_codon:yes stop_codon:yes gene_type:complete
MSSDIQSTFVEAAAADTDGISTAAAVGNNANLVLGGALTSGGAVTFDEPRNITILSAGDDSGISFTVTGTDETATAVTESITGANAGTATGSTFFATISQIAAVGNPAGNVSAGSGVSIAAPIFRGRMRLRGLYAVNTGTAGTITFREGSGTGTVRMQFNTVASANTTQYPDVPEDGILFVGGGYITYSVAGLSSMTVFYEG